MLHVVPAGIMSFPSGGYSPAGALLFDGSADDLTFDPSSASSTPDRYCLSFWAKRAALGGTNVNVIAGGSSGTEDILRYKTDAIEFTINGGGGGEIQTNAVYRDPTAWHHVFVKYDSNASGGAGDYMRMFVNGAEVTSFATDSNPSSGLDSNLLDGAIIAVGAYPDGSQNFSGYLADLIVTDNGNESVTDFGEYDSDTGIWIPKDPSTLTYGGNSFWLAFDDPSYATYGVGKDSSGRGNHFTPVSIGANNIVVDNCANSTTKQITVYPAIDPVGPWAIAQNTLSNNNLTYVAGATDDKWNYSTIPISNTDKVYMEFLMNGDSSGSASPGYIITKYGHPGANGVYPGRQTDASDWGMYIGNGDGTVQIYHDNAQVASLINQNGGASGDVFRFARHGAKAWFGVNTEWYNGGSGAASDAEVALGQKPTVTNLPTDVPLWMGFNCYGSVSITWRPYSASWTKGVPSGFGEMTSTVTGVGNAATWNPLAKGFDEGPTLSEGNLKFTADATGNISPGCVTMGVGSGKWYWEIDLISPATDGSTAFNSISIGVTPVNSPAATAMRRASAEYIGHANGKGWGVRGTLTQKWNDGSATSYGVSFTTGDTLQTYLDMDNNKIYWGKNGTLMNSANLTNGTGFAYDNVTGMVVPAVGTYIGEVYQARFTEEDWKYGPSNSDYKALMTHNMAEPTFTKPSDFFKAVAYEGNGTAIGSGGKAVTAGFQPDWVWIKNRDATDDHRLFDSIRGAQNYLESNSSIDQNQATDRSLSFPNGGYTEMLNAFTSTGFNLGNHESVNTNNESYVAWCWKAGGTPTATNEVSVSDGASMTSGSVFKDGAAITFTPHNDATVFPNKMSIASHGGFSIIDYTSTADTSSTMKYPHGLDSAPAMVINKCIDTNSLNWIVYHEQNTLSDAGAVNAADTHLQLNNSIISTHGIHQWNDEAPTAELVTLGTGGAINPNNKRCISLCFARVPGLIGIGKFTGNGASDRGPNVIIDDGAFGFKPAWIMLKKIDAAGNWFIRDNARNTFNPVNLELYSNNTDADYSDSNSNVDFTANGFKIKGAAGGYNSAGHTMIYLAFAESPFPLNNRAR